MQLHAVRGRCRADWTQDESRRFAAEFRRRADLTVDLLNEIEGVSCVRPRGASAAFPNVTGACRWFRPLAPRSSPTGCSTKRVVAVLARSARFRQPQCRRDRKSTSA